MAKYWLFLFFLSCSQYCILFQSHSWTSVYFCAVSYCYENTRYECLVCYQMSDVPYKHKERKPDVKDKQVKNMAMVTTGWGSVCFSLLCCFLFFSGHYEVPQESVVCSHDGYMTTWYHDAFEYLEYRGAFWKTFYTLHSCLLTLGHIVGHICPAGPRSYINDWQIDRSFIEVVWFFLICFFILLQHIEPELSL